MRTGRVSDKTAAEIELARRLSECASITRYDESEHKEAWALSHALHDLEASLATISGLMDRLRGRKISDDEIKDILLDVGEELRQILYHINHLKFYNYLKDGGER